MRDASALAFLEGELIALGRAGGLRERPEPRNRLAVPGRVNLCSNDYLGYVAGGRLREVMRGAVEATEAGAGASRLVLGEQVAHRELEAELAGWIGTEDALVFSSGYASNVGVLSALAGPGDLVVSDALNHASIIDGCRLSRGTVVVTPHLDVETVERALRGSTARRRWVVTESYFSMDGDGPDLVELRRVCDRFGAGLIVDEAHAVGVLGPSGRGRCAEAGVVPDVLVATLGKALGAQGAFVAGSASLCAWLWNRARSFVFSTGLSPWLAAVAIGAARLAAADSTGRRRVAEVGQRLRVGLRELGLPALSSYGPVLPLVVGGNERAVAWGRALAARGVEVQPIRPPTVPQGSARLRVTASAGLSDAEVDRALQGFEEVLRAGLLGGAEGTGSGLRRRGE